MAHRHTQFTLNEIDRFESLKERILEKKPDFVIACKEKAPTTGKEHIHIYVQWHKQVRVLAKKNKWEGAHIEKCRGTPEENKDYIEKEGDIIWKEGEFKGHKNKTSFPTIEEVEKMTKEERKQLPIQYYNIVQKINIEQDNILKASESFKIVTVIYYWGKSGCGKTKTALQYIKEYCHDAYCEVKYVNNFWIGVNTKCHNALYDDFRDSHMKPAEFINFIDYNVHNLNTKGGYVKNTFRHIFITSIQDPHKIYSNCPEEYKEQWLRRMEIRHIE